ncbi:uncharacterized protein FOMMEDRAFT_136269 [Fomitiporia mediterranea MF3/22]|uniref:uncharacterized protein n=1 Tax=Fomitiporia mediterranea (strain MF3/22) TaxID=694068 RepID=UPI000440796B|nr:uncharacterized protein FOMMEDRAFT_136269 [Fomitiporia mediterranea MF3/22]EJD00202.1 hypothetical protein FOMMEDRAFT_136269 [Fomitiporia mediterranea MF3/22]
MDYGMENCSVTVTIPENSYLNSSAEVSARIDSRASVELDVWSLSVGHRLNYKHLSWNTKPRRSAHLGILRASYGSSSQTPHFPCRSGTYETVEVSCKSDSCDLVVEANGKLAFGLYMQQYQTI